MSWHPTPTPGEMRMCAGCAHLTAAQRCALVRPDRLPPLTGVRGGREYCGWWPPRGDAGDAQPSLLDTE